MTEIMCHDSMCIVVKTSEKGFTIYDSYRVKDDKLKA